MRMGVIRKVALAAVFGMAATAAHAAGGLQKFESGLASVKNEALVIIPLLAFIAACVIGAAWFFTKRISSEALTAWLLGLAFIGSASELVTWFI